MRKTKTKEKELFKERRIMNKEQKRKEWKKKFDSWWANYLEENKIEKTKENPNGVAIGCWLDPNAKVSDNPKRRYV